MMPASKHGDPQLGIDIHMCSTPVPTPLPTPHISIVFDPFDYIPILGATVTVCGMKRAQAGTSGIVVHIPPGFPFAPMLPDKEDELFMGSSTVTVDGEPMSYLALPVLGCQIAGMFSPPRLKKKGPKRMALAPLTFNLAIPTNVFVGGAPTISLMGMAMKGAFAALGKFAKSGVFKRMRQKLFKNIKPGFLKCTILRAEPVNILSGAVSVEHDDFVLPGRIPIEWQRVYGSDNTPAGHCGHGWETPADGRLEINPDGVLMHYPGVGPLSFNGLPIAEGDAAPELELQDGAVLTDEGTEYQVWTKDDRLYHFPKSALADNTIALSKISDLCGNSLSFERQNGVLKAIQESAGRRLHVVTDRGRILEIALVVPESGERHVYVRYDYDENDDLVTVRDALGQPYTFGYDAHRMVRHTDRNGLSFYYEFELSEAGEWRVVHAWGDGGLYNYRFEYSELLRERRITDSLGNVSIVKLNEQGLPINEIDALGGVTLYEYDDAGRTIGVTDQDGHRTGYEFDERGNLVKLVRRDGLCIETQFNSASKATLIIDPLGAKWQQKWSSRGLLVEQISPLGYKSRYDYDACGRLTEFTNARGGTTRLHFDIYGNVVRVSDPLGQSVRFGYDLLGNVTGKLDELSNRTNYVYDRKSRLTEVQLASGAQIRCSYDAEDNLSAYVDEVGTQTRFEYFGQGEIARRVQSDGDVVEYAYDTEERLIGLRNQRGQLFEVKRDALGRIIEEIDYWGQPRRYSYSPAGHIRQSVDALNHTITYKTDPLGRLLKRILPDAYQAGASFEESFEYDANGNLLAAQNPHIRIERTFDAEGRLLLERQGEAFTVRNQYDAHGNRVMRETHLVHEGATIQHQVLYSYDALDRVQGIRIDDQPSIQIERNAAGLVTTEHLSPTLQRHIEHSVGGDVTRVRVRNSGKDLFETRYRRDAIGNLVERLDSILGTDRFTHDPLGRVTQHIDARNRMHRYYNDAMGDRLRFGPQGYVEAADERSEPGQWVREGLDADTCYQFDAVGNLIRRRDAHSELRLRWDANQRLVESQRDGAVTRYKYDPLGRRLEKSTGEHRTYFAWDGDALIVDRSINGATAPQREWVYYPDSFEPLAMLSGAPSDHAVLYYHNDPNGCPTRMTDSAGAVRWAASHTAWGDIAQVHQESTDQPIRLQGQYADAETGLYYNRFRYYAPALGSFISQDPLGLSAGVNTYGFAPNASAWVDPLGLTCQARLRGRTIEVLRPGSAGGKASWQTLVTIPPGATRRKLHPVAGGATQGFEYKWNDGTHTWRVRIHDADPSAPPGKNAAVGWVVRVQRGSQYADDMGTFHPPGIHNPLSPHHNDAAVNDTHIPFQQRQRFPR